MSSFAFNHKRILVVILVAAFIIRIVGLDYGLPNQFVSDEYHILAVSLLMMDDFSLRPFYPNVFYHQPLSAYVSLVSVGAYLAFQLAVGRFGSLSELKDFYLINSSNLLIVNRFMSAILSIGILYLLFLICRDLFRSEKIGILAVFLGAFELVSVELAHTGRVWTLLSFLVLFSLWWAVKLLDKKDFKYYFYATSSSILAASALLPGVFSFIPIAAGKLGRDYKKIFLSSVILIIGLLFILYLNPRGIGVVLLRYDIELPFLTNLVFDASENPGEHLVASTLVERFADPFKTIFSYAPIIFLLSIYGAFLLWKSDRQKFILLISFLSAYYIFIGPFFGYGEIARSLFPMFGYLIILAAFGLDNILSSVVLRNKKFVSGIVFGVAVLPQMFFSIIFDMKMLKPDSREVALSWVEENIAENSGIVFNTSYLMAQKNYDVLRLIGEIDSSRLNRADLATLNYPENYLSNKDGPVFFAWDLARIGSSELSDEFFKEHNFRYYVKTRWGSDDEGNYQTELFESRIREKKMLFSFDPRRNANDSFGNLMRTVSPKTLLSIDGMGPVVEVYEVVFK